MPISRAASRVLHDGQQRLAVAGALEEEVQAEREQQPDHGNQELQQLDLEAGQTSPIAS